MSRLISVIGAVLALTLLSVATALAQDEVCTSSEAPGDYYCQKLTLTLAPNSDINEVLDRLVPGAVVVENVGESIEAQGEEPLDRELAFRQWHILLAAGDDAVAAREILLADAAIEDVALWAPGALTAPGGNSGGQTLPNTAQSPSPSALVASIGVVLMAVGTATILPRLARPPRGKRT